jgi:SAM-dependent methyltransferase
MIAAMTGPNAGRPHRAVVAARYNLGVGAYTGLWSPIILPPARSVVEALDLRSTGLVLDIGTGSGALVPHIRAAAPGATVIGIDPAREMLRAAYHSSTLPTIQGDAVSLPLRTASVDAALLAFVLFHLSDPAAAMAEVARVLTGGGVLGSVTWVRDDPIRAYQEWDATLTDAGAPSLPAVRVDTGLNSPAGIDALVTGAGLHTARIWTEDLHHQWGPSTYWRFATGSGLNRMRLQQLDPTTRAEALERAHRRLQDLPIEAFTWTGQVVCAIATKP